MRQPTCQSDADSPPKTRQNHENYAKIVTFIDHCQTYRYEKNHHRLSFSFGAVLDRLWTKGGFIPTQ